MTFDTSQVDARLARMTGQIESAGFAVSEKIANDCRDYARQNAPWTDRTSNARNGLNAEAKHSPTQQQVIVYHSVPYGPWLEIRNGGAYAIILPTIRAKGPEFMTGMAGLLGSM